MKNRKTEKVRKNNLSHLRNSRNLTQEELGEVMNVGQQTISKYETSEREMSSVMINKLADFFGVTTDYLLGRVEKDEYLLVCGNPNVPAIMISPEEAEILGLKKRIEKYGYKVEKQ